MDQAGSMHERVSLLRIVTQNDPRWGPVDFWQTYAKVWAGVLPFTGTQAGAEQVNAEGVQSVASYNISLWYRTDVCAKDRILYRGKTLEIVSVVDPDGLRTTLSIQANDYPGVV